MLGTKSRQEELVVSRQTFALMGQIHNEAFNSFSLSHSREWGLQHGFEMAIGVKGSVPRAAILNPDDRFGSKADIGAPPSNVRFTPESEHQSAR